MLILRPVNTSQAVTTRCRSHSFDGYLFVYRLSFGYYAQVVAFTYADGDITGNLALPLSDLDEEKKDIRIFSVDSANSVVEGIRVAGGIEYSSDDWVTALNEIIDANQIKEIFRGSMLVTNQTDLNKYRLYGE
jgi:hypothetical protein